VLLLRELHQVVGQREDDFEAACQEWMQLLARGDDARLLWYLTQAHGGGPSYVVVTITAIADGKAWESLARRLQAGDLQPWVAQLDTLRHDVFGSLMTPLAWSPLQEVDAAQVPATVANHDLSLYMEDTMWPHLGRLHDYIERAGTFYTELLSRPEALLRLEAATRPALGGGDRSVTLLQKIRDPKAILRLLTTEIEPEQRAPGTWMHDALELRDQWESRLLRTSGWSPCW